MTFTTITFYLLGGFLCIGTSLFMFASYLKSKGGAILSLAFVFFWIGIRTLTFSVPSIVDPSNLNLLAFCYIIGTSMLFLVFLSGIQVQALMAKNVLGPRGILAASTAVVLTAGVTLGLMIFDFRTPIIDGSGVIFWNVNFIARWLVGLSSVFYGLIWFFVFYRAARLLNDSYSRYRLYCLSSAGFFIGTAGFLVHVSSSEIQTLIGHIIFIMAISIVLSIYIIPKKLFS